MGFVQPKLQASTYFGVLFNSSLKNFSHLKGTPFKSLMRVRNLNIVKESLYYEKGGKDTN